MSDSAHDASADRRTESNHLPARLWRVTLNLTGPLGQGLSNNMSCTVDIPTPELMEREVALCYLLEILVSKFVTMIADNKRLQRGDLELPDKITWQRTKDGCWSATVGMHAESDDDVFALYPPHAVGVAVSLRVEVKPMRPDLVLDLENLLRSSRTMGSPARPDSPAL